MQENKKRMSASGFSYLAMVFVLIFLMINTFFLLYSIAHKDSIDNKSLSLIFWIVEGFLIADLIWFIIIIWLHKKSIYNTYSIWILFATSLIGLFPLKLVIWFMHYFNYKKTE
ncbi:hypothetical protein [Mycoplasma todarodis]|uniref:hypothetical protein n=1 Tax=Mycoplasma todarodis TaxID=1937191 RepID=UPI003B385331